MGTILSIHVSGRPLGALIAESVMAIRREQTGVVFACANPHSAVVAQQDPEFLLALQQAEQVVADGSGLRLMAAVAGIDVGPRITGSDYFRALMTRLNESGGGRVFFLGAVPKTLEKIRERFALEFPNLTICGALSPPFGEWSEAENRAILDAIAAAKPDVLWVAMTAPKQEKWVYRNQAELRVPVIGCIGAVFDYYARTIVRAPPWICALGMEWLFRLIQEPRRLRRRTLVSSPKFILAVLRQHVFGPCPSAE